MQQAHGNVFAVRIGYGPPDTRELQPNIQRALGLVERKEEGRHQTRF
jgi:hypothetical protein